MPNKPKPVKASDVGARPRTNVGTRTNKPPAIKDKAASLKEESPKAEILPGKVLTYHRSLFPHELEKYKRNELEGMSNAKPPVMTVADAKVTNDAKNTSDAKSFINYFDAKHVSHAKDDTTSETKAMANDEKGLSIPLETKPIAVIAAISNAVNDKPDANDVAVEPDANDVAVKPDSNDVAINPDAKSDIVTTDVTVKFDANDVDVKPVKTDAQADIVIAPDMTNEPVVVKLDVKSDVTTEPAANDKAASIQVESLPIGLRPVPLCRLPVDNVSKPIVATKEELVVGNVSKTMDTKPKEELVIDNVSKTMNTKTNETVPQPDHKVDPKIDLKDPNHKPVKRVNNGFEYWCPYENCGLSAFVMDAAIDNGVFRHGAFDLLGLDPISSHATKADVDDWKSKQQLFGCGQPLQMDANEDGYSVKPCDWI